MSKHLQQALDQLRDQLLAQFSVVEHMIQLSVRSLVERNVSLADQVIQSDSVVDDQDILIEEECLRLLALHQPVASDLRWLITVIKINAELERMADLACNIAERAKALDLYPVFPVPEELTDMVQAVTGMVRRSIDACVNRDSKKAADVIGTDDLVDALNREVIGLLSEMMKEDPQRVEPAVCCISASRHIERIADLAENISEDLIYMLDGEIVRHRRVHDAPAES